jgi:hypothetical protein
MLRRLVTFALLALPLLAAAQSYRCVGKDGKKYYGSTVPAQCAGVAVEQLNAQGMVVKRSDAAVSADERAKKEAEQAEAKKRAAVAKEQGRRDSALLATYASEKEVDSARSRALEGNTAQIKETEARIEALKKKRYAAKDDQRKAIDAEIKAQEGLLASKKKEGEQISAKYDDEKRRYAELMKKGK